MRLTWNLRRSTLRERERNRTQINGTGGHRTHAHAINLAGVNSARISLVTIRRQGHFGLDLAGDVGDTIESDRERVVSGIENDVEICRSEITTFHAHIQRIGFEKLDSGRQRRQKGDEKGE